MLTTILEDGGPDIYWKASTHDWALGWLLYLWSLQNSFFIAFPPKDSKISKIKIFAA